MVVDGELGKALGLKRKVTAAESFKVEGQTPMTDEDLLGLIPEHVETRGQLNQWEAANIKLARKQLAKRKRAFDVLSTAGLVELHRMMFGKTWRWAGEYGKSLSQFSDPRTPRSVQMHDFVADTVEALRISSRTAPDIDEIAMRFHHRLTQIHPWPNGNGRHAREAADQLLRGLRRPPFTWGSEKDLAAGETRKRYIAALKAADSGDFSKLRSFVRGLAPQSEKK